MQLLDMFKNAKDAWELKAGRWLFHEGTPGAYMYVLLEGEVEVSIRGHTVLLARPGDIIGEMSMIDAKSRSASARAVTDCRVAPLDKNQFLDMVQKTPSFSLHVIRVLAERLRLMDRRLLSDSD